VSRAGVCTALISLPVKYMHTPVEAMNIYDAESIVALIAAHLQKKEA
jgi:endoglucanase